MRMTTERIPNSNTLQKEIAVPIGIIVKPYGEPSSVILNLKLNFIIGRRGSSS